MPLLGQEDLDKVGRHGQLDQRWTALQRRHRHARITGARVLASRHVIAVDHARGDVTHRKMRERPPDVTLRIPVLTAPRENDGEQSAGNHPQLPEAGYRARESPVGNSDSHAALNDLGMIHVWCSALAAHQSGGVMAREATHGRTGDSESRKTTASPAEPP